MSSYTKVMIVDDEILAIEDSLNLIFWEEHGFKVVATATNSRKALEIVDQLHPQVILVDIRMPVMSGLEFSRRVLAWGRPVKIILLTAYKDFEYAKQAVGIGVSNYLCQGIECGRYRPTAGSAHYGYYSGLWLAGKSVDYCPKYALLTFGSLSNSFPLPCSVIRPFSKTYP